MSLPTISSGRSNYNGLYMVEEKWKTIDSEYLVRSRYMTVRRDRVQLPDGRVNPEYYVLEFPQWVNVIALTREGKMVMVRQYRHGLGDFQTEIVAGYVDPGDDTLLAAAQRELLRSVPIPPITIILHIPSWHAKSNRLPISRWTVPRT